MLLAGLSLGFLGSFHCVGMCGPIALAIPVRRTSRLSVLWGTLIYNIGRVIAYSLMGLLFGLLGRGFVLAGWQNTLSVALGIFLLLALALPLLPKRYLHFPVLIRALEELKSSIRILFGKSSPYTLLSIGFLNGFLPCGFVYLAVTGALATGDILNGMLFMAAFGAGTLPAMTVVTLFRERMGLRFRTYVRKSVPVFVGIMALMLILRGLNLGIPYLSPQMVNTGQNCNVQCCSK